MVEARLNLIALEYGYRYRRQNTHINSDLFACIDYVRTLPG
jgi:hypothetical protein